MNRETLKTAKDYLSDFYKDENLSDTNIKSLTIND